MMASKKARQYGSTILHEDCLADVEPLVVADLAAPTVSASVEVVLRTACMMDRINCSYRDRLMDAVRLYTPCDQIPHVVMELNKRILAGIELRRREAAAMVQVAPDAPSEVKKAMGGAASPRGRIGRAYPFEE